MHALLSNQASDGDANVVDVVAVSGVIVAVSW